MADERDIPEIETLHRQVHSFFYLSIPGGLWSIERLADSGVVQKILHHQTPELMPVMTLIVALTLWHIPFEAAEYKMSRLKQHIRDYYVRAETNDCPVNYNFIDHFVNIAMKPLYDKSPLP